ncbi:MAG: nucleotidyl transferase AbiEii/AbiGii toxin family protein [Flavobacteriales bacterium]|nr:nucleotidyl transferase AbiEii/AbiGii toxin family protein [Flavobacteriales bacterium]
MYWSILDEQRQRALPALGFCRGEGFYLPAVLHWRSIGHRDSVDFDFFKSDAFDTALLFEHLREAFFGRSLVKVQDERNTLSVVAADSIKLSFMSYRYPLLRPVVTTEHLDLADIADIGCMKLAAITGRGTMKDYVDLYFILQRMSRNSTTTGSPLSKVRPMMNSSYANHACRSSTGAAVANPWWSPQRSPASMYRSNRWWSRSV